MDAKIQLNNQLFRGEVINFELLTDDQIIRELAKEVRAFRKKRKISQADFSEKAGISLASLKNFESGKAPTLKTVLSIYRALGKIRSFENLKINEAPTLKQRYIELEKARRKNHAKSVVTINPKPFENINRVAKQINQTMDPVIKLQEKMRKSSEAMRRLQIQSLNSKNKKDKDEQYFND